MASPEASQPIVNSFDQIKSGEFKRTPTDFHCKITAGGEYPPEPNRYVLYVSLACPWAHRTLLTRALKGLEDVIDVVVVHPVWGVVDHATGRKSWVFSHPENAQPPGPLADLLSQYPNYQDPEAYSQLSQDDLSYLHNIDLKSTSIGDVPVNDKLNSKRSLKEIYELHNPAYVGRYTVPVLFDTKTNTIVNNESSEIIQFLDTSFNEWAKYPDFTLFPASIPLAKIQDENVKMYNSFNNGVYRAGFAQSQIAYNQAQKDVYGYLDYLEDLLKSHRFIAGNEFSESDIRCIVTLFRFDSVYISHFKLSAKRIADYPTIVDYLSYVHSH